MTSQRMLESPLALGFREFEIELSTFLKLTSGGSLGS